MYFRPNDGSNPWISRLGHIGSKGLTDCQRPNDGSKVAKRWFKSHSQLRERERQIITLYFRAGLTMQEIASRMKVDASRVSQLHAAALVRLKAKVDSLLHRDQAETAETGDLSLAAGAGA